MPINFREGLVQIAINANYAHEVEASVLDVVAALSFTEKTALENGTDEGQASRMYGFPNYALTSGLSVKVDLYDLGSLDVGAGPGRDPAGQAQTNAELVTLVIRNQSTSVGTLIVGGEGSAAEWLSLFVAAGDKLKLLPGATLALKCTEALAYAIADATNHLLQLQASGGDVTFDIFFFTRDA